MRMPMSVLGRRQLRSGDRLQVSRGSRGTAVASASSPETGNWRLENAFTLETAPMDKRLLELLVCPVTHGPLVWRPQQQELLSRAARLAYPVRDGVPVMLEDEARTLSDDELAAL